MRRYATVWLAALIMSGCSGTDDAGSEPTTGTTTDSGQMSETEPGDADATVQQDTEDDAQTGEDTAIAADPGVSSDGSNPEDGAPTDLGAEVLDTDDAMADAGQGLDADAMDATLSETVTDTGTTDIPESQDADSASPDVSAADSYDVTDSAADNGPSTGDIDVGPDKPLYLLSVNNGDKTLEKINVETGEAVDVCQLPADSNYPSLTFSRNNILFASRQGSTLDAIDPCTCDVTTVGSYNGFTGVNGITSNFGADLFGVSHIQDVLIDIDTQTGAGTSVGPLGVNFGYTGATWDDSSQTIYAIDAASDALFTISPATGQATEVAPLSLAMGTVGIEMHPANGVLYACSDPSNLLSIDLVTGDVTTIGPMGQNTPCNNLAAPWQPVPCLDEL